MSLISTFTLLLSPLSDYLQLQIWANGNGRPCIHVLCMGVYHSYLDTDLIVIEFMMLVFAMNQVDPDCDFNSYQIQPLPVVEA